MKIENEVKILEVDKKQLEQILLSLGATHQGDFFQKRFTYDFNPVNPNKWVRLRTNGEKTTLAIKEIINKFSVGGTKEWEIEVSNFEETNKILHELGYTYRNYQENKRTIFVLDGVEIALDSWPKIPTYAELEADTKEKVLALVEKLHLTNKMTTFDVTSIYQEIYGIDILSIKELKFDFFG